jgi:hypothetical protein
MGEVSIPKSTEDESKLLEEQLLVKKMNENATVIWYCQWIWTSQEEELHSILSKVQSWSITQTEM